MGLINYARLYLRAKIFQCDLDIFSNSRLYILVTLETTEINIFKINNSIRLITVFTFSHSNHISFQNIKLQLPLDQNGDIEEISFLQN